MALYQVVAKRKKITNITSSVETPKHAEYDNKHIITICTSFYPL
jgi:hypothetical protein